MSLGIAQVLQTTSVPKRTFFWKKEKYILFKFPISGTFFGYKIQQKKQKKGFESTINWISE